MATRVDFIAALSAIRRSCSYLRILIRCEPGYIYSSVSANLAAPTRYVSTPQRASREPGVPGIGLPSGCPLSAEASPAADRRRQRPADTFFGRLGVARHRVRRRSLGRRKYRCVIFDAAFEAESGLVSAMATLSGHEFWFMAWNSLGTSRRSRTSRWLDALARPRELAGTSSESAAARLHAHAGGGGPAQGRARAPGQRCRRLLRGVHALRDTGSACRQVVSRTPGGSRWPPRATSSGNPSLRSRICFGASTNIMTEVWAALEPRCTASWRPGAAVALRELQRPHARAP